MICLGIESTAHSFGIGIVDEKGRVIANVYDMYKPAEGWGIHPMEAANHHEQVKEEVLKKSLEEAKIKLDDIGLVAFSQGPGLAPCLHKGLNFAKDLHERIKNTKEGFPRASEVVSRSPRASEVVSRSPRASEVALVGVNHCISHIEIGRLSSGLSDPITLYVSGANTQVIGFVSGRYRCFGETMDIGIGNALDKFGRGAGMQFPAGPKVEGLAKNGKYVELPYVVKGMDLSFSGIITDALQKLKNKKASLEDICFSLQETLFAMLAEVTERALAHTGKNEVLLTGGVAANQRLQEMLTIMCAERGAKFAVVPRSLSGDNGVMISWLGILMHKAKMKTKDEILPRQRTDDVDVKWI